MSLPPLWPDAGFVVTDADDFGLDPLFATVTVRTRVGKDLIGEMNMVRLLGGLLETARSAPDGGS
jgi:hypothetical protein